jgi:thiol:disulfide interchange protein DsbA
MKHLPAKKKRFLTVILALAGIIVILAYHFCFGSCSYLKGSVLGVDLKYLGILYMIAIVILALTRQTLLCLFALAFGSGGEIFLIGYQVRSGVYCPYCLVFAAVVILTLIVNFERSRRWFTALTAGAGLIFFLLFFSGSTTLTYTAGPPLPAFGKGPVEVRVYTDYFCGPCLAEEAEVMALITELVEKNLIRVIFIDTPIHKETVLYAGYFLSALNAKEGGDLRQAVTLRAALFEAAVEKIADKEGLELFLKKKGIALRPFDTAPVFKIFGNYLKEDRINATPSCVIVGPQGKQTLVGRDDTLKALRSLRK